MTVDPERIDALTDQFEKELIERARAGDEDAGREILYTLALAIDAGRFDSPLFPFLAECLLLFARDGVPLERALCVEKEPSRGGRPLEHDSELAAVDILLRKHGGFTPEQALDWIEQSIGASRSTVRRLRVTYTPMQALERNLLLRLTGSLQVKAAEALHQNSA